MALPAPSLDQVDPAEAWSPWRPTSADPWGPKWAAHLYRRAGFGPSPDELDESLRLGPDGTLDLLMRGRPGSVELLDTLNDVGRIAAEHDNGGDDLVGWWLYVILNGGHPLREKMTLFWHNHFATSLAKVQDPRLMFRQNALLRSHALGRFGPLLQAMSRDGAMLVWLDSNSNVKGRPNENYARELMELFSLGVGHYTEKDVREAARAFTGWRTDGVGFAFDPRLHDAGEKTILGQTGPWDGGDVVRIVLQQPDAARFLLRKLYRLFISEQESPPDSLLEPLCSAFRKSQYDVAALVRTILASRHFYSAHAFRRRIKDPVEFTIGAVRAVWKPIDPDEGLRQQPLVNRIRAMGQALFAPPSVKGWPGGPAWLNTSTVLERDNFAEALTMGTLWPAAEPNSCAGAPAANARIGQLVRKLVAIPAAAGTPENPPPRRSLDSARILDGRKSLRPENLVDALVAIHLPGGIPTAKRARLAAFVARGRPTGPALATRVRETVHAIMTMTEFQLA
ncbi:MAG: DUF1800 domain-containing protein [Isosphaeraceae bacterium]